MHKCQNLSQNHYRGKISKDAAAYFRSLTESYLNSLGHYLIKSSHVNNVIKINKYFCLHKYILNIFTLKNWDFLEYLLLIFRKLKEYKMLRRSRIL